MHYILETDRLKLREFTPDDTEFILELLNSPGWLQYIGDRNIKTEEQAKNYLLNGPIKSYRENGYGLWLVEKKDDLKAIGMCGIINRDTLDNPDIGFAFLPEHNGKGYAFEVASATMAYAKEVLKLPTIAAITVPDNQRSIKLLEKIGLQYVKTFCLANSQEELLLYSN
ncbi:GNAT family N-acetyltransferase [Pontibacter sp. KCTC 32443]|uniref:GNAT family N-acetyltransferase n=1 Tax=Pontibacter TaxID=323449 RepID=UPI00164E3CD6|nr:MULTISPECIES: GNAT family N-acetyltransferase [Pontibacter]MBC5775307.1 GNAT family N-acetyltransferase [Pontibacter sp. KCTC 32443]